MTHFLPSSPPLLLSLSPSQTLLLLLRDNLFLDHAVAIFRFHISEEKKPSIVETKTLHHSKKIRHHHPNMPSVVTEIHPAMDSLSILAMAAALVQDYDKQNQPVKSEFSIRQARSTDIPLLEYVERSAAEIYRTVGLDHLLDGATVDPNLLAYMAISNTLLVAVNRWDQPIGFIGGQNIVGNFHIIELSVAQSHQGKGVGKALMSAIYDQARREGYRALTLTTFRHLPWNGPWYQRLGFGEVIASDWGREYEEILDHEAQNGLDTKQRCVMALPLRL